MLPALSLALIVCVDFIVICDTGHICLNNMSNNKKAVAPPNLVSGVYHSSRMMLKGKDNDHSWSLELSVTCSGRRKKLNDSIKCDYLELVVWKHDLDRIIT